MEISAQEIAYHILGMPLSVSSRSCIYINTLPPNERCYLLKSKQKLQKVLEQNPNSTDIIESNIIEHYINRPDEMEEWCLADFAAKCQYSKTIKNKIYNNEDENDDDDECDIDENMNQNYSKHGDNKCFKLKNNNGFVRLRNLCKVIRYRSYNIMQDESNYYREQLMLFTHWRDENNFTNTDVMNINELFKEHINEISKNRTNYLHNDSIENEITDALNDVQNDNVEQYNDNIEKKTKNSMNDELAIYEINEPIVDIGLEMPNNFTTSDNIKNISLPHQISNDEYYSLIRELNEKQYKYHHDFTYRLRNKNDIIYHFINGSAGTGKSKLIKALTQTIIRHYNSIPGNDPNNINVLLCAYTGKAAFNIKGITLHSTFSLPVNNSVMTPLTPENLNTLSTKLLHLKFLIIDEISMVGCRTLNQINKRLQEIFHSNELFGGISVIVFGDFNQLQPVMDGWIFDVQKNDPLSILSGPYLWNLFSIYELDEIMRQKDDHFFASALNNLANESTSEEMNALFKSREVGLLMEKQIYPPQTAVHLFHTNDEKDSFNIRCIQNSDNESYVAKAIDVCVGNTPERVKSNLLNNIKKLPPQKTQNLSSEIIIKINTRYMITVNVDVEDGITNGACGRLKYVTWGENKKKEKQILRVYIEFEDIDVGKMARNKWENYMINHAINSNWTPIEHVTRTIAMRQNSIYKVLRKQIPITPAEGITIHKSQGSTFENIVVHTGRRRMNTRLLYVAFSRVTSLNGLFIAGEYVPPTSKTSDAAKREIERLRRESPLKFILKFPQDFEENDKITVIFNNVRSLNKHLLDITKDRAFISADILILVETWSLNNDPLFLNNFCLISNKDCGEIRKPFGHAVFVKEKILKNTFIQQFYDESFEQLIYIKGIFVNHLALIFLYSKTNAPFHELKLMIMRAYTTLNRSNICYSNIIIMGDFNIDLRNEKLLETKQLKDLMSDLKLMLATPSDHSSTIYGSQIDYCFSLSRDLSAHYYETIFSDHKAIWFQF